MKKKSIVRQVQERFESMAAYGESKYLDKKMSKNHKPAANKIYSYSTMKNYIDAGVRFAKWARDQHGCKTVEEAEQYTGAYLQYRMDKGLSAWTVLRDAAALAKLYQKLSTELGVNLPSRQREEVHQHRREETWRGHFSEKKHWLLVETAKACGLRSREFKALRPEDVQRTADGKCIVHVARGKGGKERWVEALSDAPARAAEAAAAAGQELVFPHIPKYAPLHYYRRAFYAQNYYDSIARPIQQLKKKEKYICRGDSRSGEVFDRDAVLKTSQQLGHGRRDVAVASYLQGYRPEKDGK